MGKSINLTGMRFGILTVIRKHDRDKNYNTRWECLCDCGKSSICYGDNLRRNHTKSCGCLKENGVWAIENLTTHGQTSDGIISSEYTAWANMITRCTNEKNERYVYYGGKGVSVCERWLNSFENFYADMGPRPSPQHSIDRIDVNGNYDPLNCRWATKEEQANNKTNNVWYEYEGIKQTQTWWAKYFGVTNSAIVFHLRKGKTFREVFVFYKNKTRPAS